ncbi:Holliday junction branch migration protein RuvA [bacterium]|nr:Holliday junction branch migration protein RuvA [bacterium]
MIAYLKGLIAEKNPTRTVLDVSGVGYEVLIPVSSYEKLAAIGEPARLLTYLHVREDIMQLYGFSTQEEREVFLLLISVSGIGPKSALGILSSVALPDFKKAIAQEDYNLLTAVPGIGKKTAQRLVVELKEKVAKISSADDIARTKVVQGISEVADEAMMALMSLGYAKALAEKSITRALRENPGKEFSLQELIKTALRFATAG